MTSEHEKRLREANRILADSDYGLIDGRPHGYPKYQYFHESDLWVCEPLTNSDGSNRMEFICACGIDRQVHEASCGGLTLACVKFVRTRVAPTLRGVYVLCVWTPPPSEEAWQNHYGSFRYYPSQGRYIPLTVNNNFHTLPFPPHSETARIVVKMVRDHETNKVARMEAQDRLLELREAKKTPDYTPPPGSHFQRNRDLLKDRMTLNGHRAGTRGSVSYPMVGGIPLVGRPDPRHESQLPPSPGYAAPPTVAPLIQLSN